MKAIRYALLVLIPLAYSCHKSASLTPLTEYNSTSWQLEQKKFTGIGPESGIRVPSIDSSVLLVLGNDYTYTSALNGRTVSQGTYSNYTDSAYLNNEVLQLNDFKTTGLLSLSTFVREGSSGQILSTFDGLFMRISNDSLYLTNGATPDGELSYIFVKK